MLKMINIRNFIIIVLCITIVCMGVGFAYLSMKLRKCSVADKSYNVSIIKVNNGTSIKGGTTAPSGTSSIINGNKTVNFLFTMRNPKDALNYHIIIKNNGTIAAQIDNIIETPDYINDTTMSSKISPVKIEHNNIVGRVIKPEEEIDLTVKAIYGQTPTPTTKSINYQISILTSEVK